MKHNLDAYEAALTGSRASMRRCFAGYLYTRVSVEGRVFFCCAHLEAGSLQHERFADVWGSARYQAMRAQMERGEWFDACARCGKYDMNFNAERELTELQAEGLLS